jgi:hypothetical protein
MSPDVENANTRLNGLISQVLIPISKRAHELNLQPVGSLQHRT